MSQLVYYLDYVFLGTNNLYVIAPMPYFFFSSFWAYKRSCFRETKKCPKYTMKKYFLSAINMHDQEECYNLYRHKLIVIGLNVATDFRDIHTGYQLRLEIHI